MSVIFPGGNALQYNKRDCENHTFYCNFLPFFRQGKSRFERIPLPGI